MRDMISVASGFQYSVNIGSMPSPPRRQPCRKDNLER